MLVHSLQLYSYFCLQMLTMLRILVVRVKQVQRCKKTALSWYSLTFGLVLYDFCLERYRLSAARLHCTELTVFFNRSITHLLVFLIVKCTCNTKINNIAILTNFSISYLALTIWILYMVSSDDWENQLTVSE